MNNDPRDRDDDDEDWYDDEDRNRYFSSGVRLCEEAVYQEQQEDERIMEWVKGH